MSLLVGWFLYRFTFILGLNLAFTCNIFTIIYIRLYRYNSLHFFITFLFVHWGEGKPGNSVKSQDPDPRRFGRRHFGCHDSCTISGRPRNEKSVSNEMHNNIGLQEGIWTHCLRSNFTNMAEDTSNTNIPEQDPFNEDEVRWEFGATSRHDVGRWCFWEVALPSIFLTFLQGIRAFFVPWKQNALLSIP